MDVLILNELTLTTLYFHNFIIPLTIIAIGVHASASVTLLFFLFEQWDCTIYWWILAICRLVQEL